MRIYIKKITLIEFKNKIQNMTKLFSFATTLFAASVLLLHATMPTHLKMFQKKAHSLW